VQGRSIIISVSSSSSSRKKTDRPERRGRRVGA
jgi:hypothetical protein